MADLPKDKLTTGDPPFTNTGVDYVGPIEVKRGRTTVKRYDVVFTCMNIRAIHLELAHSLDTDSCINAIRRFVVEEDRSGSFDQIMVPTLWELNGSCVRRSIIGIMPKSVLSQKNITLHFNPPSGSHFGGIWERQIRTIRKILYSLLREQMIHLQTLFCEVESIVNCRPISKVSKYLNDLGALTPNHLLLLQANQLPSPGIFNKSDSYVQHRWRQVQYLADVFWKRWTREYLLLLQERQKCTTSRRNLQVGDIVLFVDNNAPGNSWPMGRFREVMQDYKDLVRIVRVKTRMTSLLRPVDKICMILMADQ
ncbi:uncharacterized protein LOC144344447 [Saccoglossus kowalevskii]